jgi:4-hydroxy-tetrahydrodipicolinate synthase
VVSGDDALTLPILAVGGSGVISVTSNIAPAEMLEMVGAHRAGDAARARAVHQKLLPLFDALFIETNPIPIKAAAADLGHCSDEIRLPLTEMTPPNRERLKVVMKELGLL